VKKTSRSRSQHNVSHISKSTEGGRSYKSGKSLKKRKIRGRNVTRSQQRTGTLSDRRPLSAGSSYRKPSRVSRNAFSSASNRKMA